jgi:uncharacterized protein with PIN domain
LTASDIGTWIGTAFSLLGALVAVWQARQAKTAAQQVEEFHDDIVGKHEQSELTELQAALEQACKAMDKYGPGAGSHARLGTNPESDAAAVRAFAVAIDRHRELLLKTFGETWQDRKTQIFDRLNEFGDAATDADRAKAGLQIYLEITQLSGNLQSAVKEKVFGLRRASPKVRTL